MIALLLLPLALMQTSGLAERYKAFVPQQLYAFRWDVVPSATLYNIYVANPADPWQLYATMVPPIGCGPVPGHPCDMCSVVLDADLLPPDLVFMLVTAANQEGESPTEHGAYAGEGYFPMQQEDCQ